MKKVFILILLLSLFESCTYERRMELTGTSLDVNSFENEIKDVFQADSVKVFLLVVKEEPYFEEFQVPSIIIYNPKKLSDNTPISLDDDWRGIYQAFKEDARPFATRLDQHCNQYKYCQVSVQVPDNDDEIPHFFGYDRNEKYERK